MRTISTLLGLVFIAGIATAHGNGCETSEATATLETPVGTYYVVNDLCQLDGCVFSFWVYEESNGHPGLQRCDETWCDGCEGDTIWI